MSDKKKKLLFLAKKFETPKLVRSEEMGEFEQLLGLNQDLLEPRKLCKQCWHFINEKILVIQMRLFFLLLTDPKRSKRM